MGTMAPGMWLQLQCVNRWGISFKHDGIVVDVSDSSDAAIIEVLHFAWQAAEEKRVICSTTLEGFLACGTNARIISAQSSFTPAVVVARARSQLGRADYNLFGRNCQHFAYWCYNGSAFSREVFRISAFGAGVGLAIAFVSIIGMGLARGSMSMW